MRKEKVITRTFTSLSVKVMGLDEKNNVAVEVQRIPVMEEKKILAYLLNNAAPDFTPCKVVSVDTIEELRGMTESTFLANSFPLPPRKDYSIKEDGTIDLEVEG